MDAQGWTCPACHAHVFASRTTCYKCKTRKPEEPSSGAIQGFLPSLWAWLSGTSTPMPPPPPPVASGRHDTSGRHEWYAAAQRKENTMVAVHLQSSTHPEVRAWVGSYHMPCAFVMPKLMAMHAALAMQHLQRLAAATKAPCILGGDWNIKPLDPTYRLLTSGRMDDRLVSHYPTAPEGDSWTPDLFCPMSSAYAAAHDGAEPDFTNYSQVKDEAPFIGCLDYVFISPHVRAVGAPVLPHRSTQAGPLPTATEPSDHILLAVDLELPTSLNPSLIDVYGAAAEAGTSAAGESKRSRVTRTREEANEQLRQARLEELEAFLQRPDQLSLDFSSSLNSFERRIVHALAEELNLLHTSHGEGFDRFIRVEKPPLVEAAV